MQFESASDIAKLQKIREHVAKNERTNFPTPAAWARWLVEQYRELPGALQPSEGSVLVRFDDVAPRDKLSKLFRLLACVEESGDRSASIPTPWVAWLLTEYDRLTTVQAALPST